MDYRNRITIEPGKRGGKPRISVIRMTVYDGLDYLTSAMTSAEILADLPYPTAEDIRACPAYASNHERHLITIAARNCHDTLPPCIHTKGMNHEKS